MSPHSIKQGIDLTSPHFIQQGIQLVRFFFRKIIVFFHPIIDLIADILYQFKTFGCDGDGYFSLVIFRDTSIEVSQFYQLVDKPGEVPALVQHHIQYISRRDRSWVLSVHDPQHIVMLHFYLMRVKDPLMLVTKIIRSVPKI